VVWGFNNHFMVPDCIPQVFVFNDLFLVFGLFGRAKRWVEIWDNSDKPVFLPVASQWILAALYFGAVFLVEHQGWRRHIFVANAHGANRGFGGFLFGFGEICGSAATFSCDYDPAVKQIVFSKFIIRHG
jgi:hypothetical protein